MIEPTASFKDNLQLLPSIEGLAQINLIDADGNIVATIETSPASKARSPSINILSNASGR